MQTRYSIEILSVLGCLLIARPVYGHEEHKAGAEPSKPGEQVVQQGKKATLTPPPCTPNTTDKKQDKVTPGTYCVCDVTKHGEHDQFSAPHLALDEKVIIPAIDWVTTVQLGNTTADMDRSADTTELTALISYEHENTETDRLQKVTHLVRITPADAPAGTTCKPGNVLKISFCFKAAGNQKWVCGPDPGGHNGDTHVQN